MVRIKLLGIVASCLVTISACGGTTAATSNHTSPSVATPSKPATFAYVALPGSSEFGLGGYGARQAIAYASDGNLFYATSSISDQLYIVSPAGQVTTVAGPQGAKISALTSDGQGGFTIAQSDSSIGSISGGGGQTISEFRLLHPYSALNGVSLGAHSLSSVTTWATEIDYTDGTGQHIAGSRIIAYTGTNTGQSINEFALPSGVTPYDIAMGSDGNQWFADSGSPTNPYSNIVKITPRGTMTSYPVPSPDEQPTVVTEGADGNIWFLDVNEKTEAWAIGRVTPSGSLKEFPIPVPHGAPAMLLTDLAQGADGRMWVSEINTDVPYITGVHNVSLLGGNLIAVAEDSGTPQFISVTKPGVTFVEPFALTADASGDISFLAATAAAPFIGTYGPTAVVSGAVTPPPVITPPGQPGNGVSGN